MQKCRRALAPRTFFAAFIFLLTAIAGVPARAQTLTVGVDPSAIVFNSVTNKYYVGSSPVAVINGATNAVTTIAGTGFSSAYALNSVTNKIYYIGGNNDQTLMVIDGATNTVSSIALGSVNAEALAVNPVTNKIYVAIGNEAGALCVVDGVTGVVTTLAFGSANEAVAVNPVTNKIYVASGAARIVTVVDGVTNAITNLNVPTAAPFMAVNTTTNQIYLATDPTAVIDGASNVVTTLGTPAGGGFITAFAYNPATNNLYVGTAITGSNSLTQDGTVTVINGSTGATTPITVGVYPGAIAVDTATDTILVADEFNAMLTEINGVTNATTSLPAGMYPYAIAVNPATNQFYIANSGDGTVTELIGPAGSPVALPAFTTQPVSQTVVSGTTVVFNSAATGTPAPTYQWKLNGANVANATSARLVITGATAANAGTYTCVATNSQGSATTTPVTLALTTTTNVGRLVNLSVNTTAGKSQVLTVGFVSGGSGTTGSENLLIRATGPALANLGVPNTLVDPTLTVLNGQTVVASNDNWGTPASNQTAVTAADSATFAFPLTNPASLDAALAQLFPAAAYTAQISGNTAAVGTALAEVYDNTSTASYTLATPRLVNISANNQIAANGSMTAGFVVGGSTAKTVLIRATGPALALLGVGNTIPDPQIALHTTVNSQDTVLATNAGWGGDPQITAVSNSVFAFPLTNPASKDSVVLVTLAPGSYTAIASSVTGTAGVVLIEVYEVP